MKEDKERRRIVKLRKNQGKEVIHPWNFCGTIVASTWSHCGVMESIMVTILLLPTDHGHDGKICFLELFDLFKSHKLRFYKGYEIWREKVTARQF